MTSNVDYYCAAFDADGKRIYSAICDFDPMKDKNADKLQALKDKAKETVSDAAVIEIITADDFNAYLGGKVRGSDGKPTEYVAPEPTESEKKQAAIATIKAKYNSQLDAMVTARVKAAMLGADTSKIDANYKNTLAAMAAEIKNA
jgi:hypothetical protein